MQSRLFSVELGIGHSTYGPTGTHRRQLEIVEQELATLRPVLAEQARATAALVARLIAAGAPWIEGQPLPNGGR